MQRGVADVSMQAVVGESLESRGDQLAVEEPLEIRLVIGPATARRELALSITMRTPGHDAELAAGFLLGEGIVSRSRDVAAIRHCGTETAPAAAGNVIRVELREGLETDIERLQRHFYTTSSCGVCGKSSLEALNVAAAPLGSPGSFRITAEAIHQLPGALRDAQAVFARTGGLHAAALFDDRGRLIGVREDVGRHNAVDKVIGSQLLADQAPLANRGLIVSGRASFELMQKALVAGIPLLAAVGAPSSLAVELAKRYGATLLGFVRDGRFNAYNGMERIAFGQNEATK
jgi:FdhD protein